MTSATSARYYSYPRSEMLRYVPRATRRLLDVGCARGVFSRSVKARLGCETWGVELDPEAAAAAARALDRVICADVHAALRDLPPAYFDCVVFNDVLEHLVDPYAALAEVRRHLAPGGVVVASIPNVRYYRVSLGLLLLGRWSYADEGVLDRTHLRFFTRRSIRQMFAEQGYRMERIEAINAPIVGRMIGRLLPGGLGDLPYMQFACVARPRPSEDAA